MKRIFLFILLCFAVCMHATIYQGRVVDQNGAPVSYATVYPEAAPELGTATNNDGLFSFKADLPNDSRVIISFIGYEKLTISASLLTSPEPSVFTLREQPIALEETVVAAKKSKQRNKRKQMATLLHAVYVKLADEFPDTPTRYSVVSDVRMDSEGSTWGMEQMIADIVVLPQAKRDNTDSIQFKGRYCKRFFDAQKRKQADELMASNAFEHMEKKAKTIQTIEKINAMNNKNIPQNFMRRAANSLDSGVIVHRSIFAMGNMRQDFEKAMGDLKHWTVSNESEGETVLTHTEKIRKYLGCFKMTIQRHFIIDSRTYAVKRFSEHADIKITIPFGIKLNEDQLMILNLINMDNQHIEKFRLKKMRGNINMNTIFQRVDGFVYTEEKNLLVNANIIGSKNIEIPIIVKGTQRVTDLQTKNVKTFTKKEITRRLQREIVKIE